jgi:predicted CXXCH cytochrome family protein
MKQVLLMAAIVIAICGTATAQSVVGTAHDLSATGPGVHANTKQVCVFCHTPHQASTASGQEPLWNHTLSSTGSYGTYGSSSMDATVTDIGAGVAGSAAASNLCMSCHDGTVAVHSMWNPPNEVASVTITAGGNVGSDGLITGTPMLGSSLVDDHPINFTYDSALAAADAELIVPASTSWVDAGRTVPLFEGKVQCASCHDVHKNPDGQQPFLVKNNDASALCRSCHVK